MIYNFSIAAVFKNEEKYIKEWIEHHLNRNVDHIYLIDDFSNDNYLDVIYPYMKKKYVTIIENHTEDSEYGRQDRIYNNYLHNYARSSNWFGIIDIDEYLWSPYNLNLQTILNQLEKVNIEGIIIWNLVFGGNGHINQPDCIVDSFTKREDILSKLKKYKFTKAAAQKYLLQAYYCKQIVRTKNLKKFGVHTHNFEGFTDFKNKNLFLDPFDIENNVLRLNHYKWQSKERWNHKVNLPDVNAIEPEKMSHIEPFREKYNQKEMKKTRELMKKRKILNYRQINNLYDIISPEVNEIEDFALKMQKEKYGQRKSI